MGPARVVHHKVVGSTNDSAFEALVAHGGPVWVVAREQSAGRGRRGRAWSSPPGNLYASLAFAEQLAPGGLAILPLAAGVALGRAIADVSHLRPQLKWPNDILIDGRKVAGVLVEVQHKGPAARVVVGFGTNVADTACDGATCLRAFASCTADSLFARLQAHALRVVNDLIGQTDDAVARIREDWLANAVGIGEDIVVRFEASNAHGRFVGLDPCGRLMLSNADGITHIHAGDVFLRTRVS